MWVLSLSTNFLGAATGTGSTCGRGAESGRGFRTFMGALPGAAGEAGGAGGDAAGGIGLGRDDGERAVAVLGVQLLLDRGEERVKVDVEEAEAIRLGIAERLGSWRFQAHPPLRY